MKHLNSEHLSAIAAMVYPHVSASNSSERVVFAVEVATDLIRQSKAIAYVVNKKHDADNERD